MNNKRRAAIRKIIDEINRLSEELEELKNEEEEYYDNMPEPLQDSERGELALENVEQLQQATSELGGAMCDLQHAVGEQCARQCDCDAIVGLLQAVCEQIICKQLNAPQPFNAPRQDALAQSEVSGPSGCEQATETAAVSAGVEQPYDELGQTTSQPAPESDDNTPTPELADNTPTSQAKFIEEAIAQLNDAAVTAKECTG
ncbi:MAG: hypothetical protein FWD58_09520 [Firmicutes bacterium]|nr:hypothetical protein [Bacillota bacterium]